MSQKQSSDGGGGGGIGLLGVLFVALLVLKLVGVIDWSWWWVAAPLFVGGIPWIVLALIGVWVLVPTRRESSKSYNYRVVDRNGRLIERYYTNGVKNMRQAVHKLAEAHPVAATIILYSGTGGPGEETGTWKKKGSKWRRVSKRAEFDLVKCDARKSEE